MISCTINQNIYYPLDYNAEEHRKDHSYYDLLASEARLASFVGIAQGKLPQESWFALGQVAYQFRQVNPILLSWSGSMFEYLMPSGNASLREHTA